MPTLLTINNYYYRRGGAETIFLEENKIFAAQGWTVIPFSMKHAKNLDTPWSPYFVDEIEFGRPYSSGEQLVRIPKVIFSLEARRNLKRLLARVSPDVAHAHNIYHHISPSILGLLKRRQIPTVLTLHDLKIACPEYHMLAPDGVCERCRGGRLHNVLLHRCIKGSASLSAIVMVEAIVHRLLGSYSRCVSRFVVPSRFYLEKFCEWGMPRSAFRHVPNFVDVDRYKPQFAVGRDFLYLGRLSREKGVLTLIRATAEARCRLLVAGTGPELEEMRSLAARLDADVVFLGFLTGDMLHDVIRGARCVVLPSEWYENAPMSLLEAYALGKPIIGARIGGIPELIQDNESGMSFSSGDVHSLVSALREMTDKPNTEIERMGRFARHWVESAFTPQIYGGRMLDVYRELGVDVRSGGVGP